ncbi:MAG TPA: hypothetical protein VGI39_06225 [Polyangiaceae bacterium]
MSGEVTVRSASPRDNDELIALTRACPMEGDIGLCMDRGPDFFALNALEGERWRVGVATTAEGRIVGSVAATQREVWLDGVRRTIGYAGDLKVHPDFRDRRHADALQRWCGEAIAEMCGPDVPILVTVLAGNKSMETRTVGPRGLHVMRKIGTTRAHTVFLLWKRSPPKVSGLTVRRGEERDLAAMAELWTQLGPKRQFALTYGDASIPSWIARAPSLSVTDYWLAFAADGRLAGFTGFWDQESFKHMRVTRYSTSLRRARVAFNAVAPALGATKLPAEGDTLRYVTGVNVCVPSERPDVFRAIVVAAYNAHRSRGYSFMSIPLDQSDRLAAGLEGLMAQPTDINAFVTGPRGSYEGPDFAPGVFHNEIALV